VNREGRLHEVPHEQAVRRLVLRLRNEEGWSFVEIANGLNRWGSRGRGGKAWYSDLIHKVFRRADQNFETPPEPKVEIETIPSKFLPGQLELFSDADVAIPPEAPISLCKEGLGDQ
jgi:hypothetical protein